ncbi:MAG: hypothetical protein UZ03_NOB001003244 [Nitrospira sp. OLB3]|nr:MAG: hypothetical protein UZ03_NOB001003244 [Nitrospira sp. OLB3]
MGLTHAREQGANRLQPQLHAMQLQAIEKRHRLGIGHGICAVWLTPAGCSRTRRRLEVADQRADCLFQLLALDDHVDHPMVEQKFRTLKLVG